MKKLIILSIFFGSCNIPKVKEVVPHVVTNIDTNQVFDPVTQQPHTAHTLTAVPLVLVNPPKYTLSLNKGLLADVAPTILRLLELNKPDEMTGVSLISEQNTI